MKLRRPLGRVGNRVCGYRHCAAQHDIEFPALHESGIGPEPTRRRPFMKEPKVGGDVVASVLEATMETILIIVLLIVLLGGGGWYGRGRWYGRRRL